MEHMNKLSLAKVIAITAALVATSTATASAATTMPLSSKWRACDFSSQSWVNAVGYARVVANVSSTGSTVVVNVDMLVAPPDMHYDVRVIQMPRPSIGCAPGAPGVITGGLQTNGAGAGNVTLQGPIQSGATGAWVIVERPSDSSQTPAEFYTSTFVASI
jgi:hypothetical protein